MRFTYDEMQNRAPLASSEGKHVVFHPFPIVHKCCLTELANIVHEKTESVLNG